MKLTKVTVESAIKDLCDNINASFVSSGLKNYGEAVESILENAGANYVTIDGSQYCAIDDTSSMVVFLVRESASVEATPAGGRASSLLRTVSFKLIANSKLRSAEFALTTLINRTKGITYQGTGYDSKAIARQYFGITEHNFETSFFTIDFQVTEKISCEVSC
jgi:hypothetical protein